jgi:protein O-mannosyl-transferase
MGRKPRGNRPPSVSGTRRVPSVVSGTRRAPPAAAIIPRSSPPPAVDRPYAVLGICGLLVLAVVLVFGRTARHEFVNLDDKDYVYENPHVLGGLTIGAVRWSLTNSYSANWHPLTWISHMADWQFYGDQAGGHHVTSVVLHAAAVVWLFLVLLRMTGGLWPSTVAAAIFAVHPQHVESVAWVAERKDVLSGLLFVATLAAYVRYATRPGWGRYAIVVLCYALGLAAKPMLVTLPFVLLLLDFWPLGRVSGTRRVPSQVSGTRRVPLAAEEPTQTAHGVCLILIEKLPLFVLSAASCAVTIWAQGQVAAFRAGGGLAWHWRAGNAAVSYAAYLAQALWPAGLAVYYPHPGSKLPPWQVLVATGVLLGISAACIAWARKRPYLIVGWLWYLGMLVPVIGLVQVGAQGRADRYMYLPQIGLSLMVVWGAADLAKSISGWRWQRLVCGAAAGGVVLLLAGCAWRQTAYWHDSAALWNHTLKCTANNHYAHNNLGNVLIAAGLVDDARRHYERAVKINPDYAEAHNNLARVLERLGQSDDAIGHYQEALSLNPDDPITCNNVGAVLLGRGRLAEAEEFFRKAAKINPDYAEAHHNLGLALRLQGKPAEAVGQLREAVVLRPNHVSMLKQLAWALATCPEASLRDGAEAVGLAQRAARLSQERDPAVLGTLAAAYAEAGRFAEAAQTARRAADLAAAQHNDRLAGFFAAMIPPFENQTAFRAPLAGPAAAAP